MTYFLSRLLMRIRPTGAAALLKRLIGIEREVQRFSKGSFFIDPASHLGMCLIKTGEYEPQMCGVLTSLLKDGDVFIDLGANEGYFTVVASKLVGPEGTVFSIEPQRRLKAILQRNCALNDADNTTLIEQAVSDRTGSAIIHISPDTNTGSTGLVRACKYRVPAETVETVTLDTVFRLYRIGVCDLMKIDIEGLEFEAILGSPDIFKQHRIRHIVLQLHPRLMLKRGRRPEDITEFLKGCGYSIDDRFEELVFTSAQHARAFVA